jgi:hypothetical protein
MADGLRWSALAWQPAGKRLAVADERGQLRVWDTQRMTVVATARYRLGLVESLAWSADGRYLAIGGIAGLYVLEAKTLSLKAHPWREPVKRVAFSGDGRTVVATGTFGLRGWQTTSWKQTLKLPGDLPVAYPENRPRILFRETPYCVASLDLPTQRKQRWDGFASPVTALAVGKVGQFAAGDDHGRITMIDPSWGRPRQISVGTNPIMQLHLSSATRRLLVVTPTALVQLSPPHYTQRKRLPGRWLAAAWSSDGTQCAATDREGNLSLIEAGRFIVVKRTRVQP